jgi:hypothetical protein
VGRPVLRQLRGRDRARSEAGPGDPAVRLTFVDFGFFYPLAAGDFTPYVPAPDEIEIFGARHWLTHPLYAFEGNTIEERRLLFERRYRVRIYRSDGP